MNWRVLVSIVTALTYTVIFVIVVADYEAWRMGEMDKDPFTTLHPFTGTFNGGLMMIVGIILWSAVGITYLRARAR